MVKEVMVAKEISKRFKELRALDNVSLSFFEGEIFSLLGPNGAGKSTLIKISAGTLEADSGKVIFSGSKGVLSDKETSRVISVVPQEECFYRAFSAEENIKFFGTLYGYSGTELQERTDLLLEWLKLDRFRNKTSSKLSGGYRRLLNIACSLVHDPKIIFMDEPTVGLDPKMRKLVWNKIRNLRDLGKTVCLTTHYMDEAQELSDRVALIVDGHIALGGAPDELIAEYGGASTLILALSEKIGIDLIVAVKEIAPTSQISVDENVITVSLSHKDVHRAIPEIYKAISNSSLKVMSSFRKEPDLEDVFIHVTGEKLREKGRNEVVEAGKQGA